MHGDINLLEKIIKGRQYDLLNSLDAIKEENIFKEILQKAFNDGNTELLQHLISLDADMQVKENSVATLMANIIGNLRYNISHYKSSLPIPKKYFLLTCRFIEILLYQDIPFQIQQNEKKLFILEARRHELWDSLIQLSLIDKPSTIDFLVELPGGRTLLYFIDGATKQQHIESLLELECIKIDHQDDKGNTMLHYLAEAGELRQFLCLLWLGADQTLKNNDDFDPWQVALHKSSDKNFQQLALMVINKQALSPLPQIGSYEGPICGFSASYDASRFLRHTEEFSEPLLPLTKQGTEETSLRYLRHELGIGGIGGIFSAEDLAKVIAKTGCQAKIFALEGFQHFMAVIKASIEFNFPLIVPYSTKKNTSSFLFHTSDCNSFAPNPRGKGDSAHWAQICGFGYDENAKGRIAIGIPENFLVVDAKDLFLSCQNLRKFSKANFVRVKDDSQKDKRGPWMRKELDYSLGAGFKFFEHKEVNLSQMQSRLVVVAPPGIELEQKFEGVIALPAEPPETSNCLIC